MSDVNSSLDKLASTAADVAADTKATVQVVSDLKDKPSLTTTLADTEQALKAIDDVRETIADARQAASDVKAQVIADPNLKTNRVKIVARWVLDRLSEKSTWTAITTTAVTLLGMRLSPENAEAIGVIGTLIASTVLASISTRV